MLGKNYEEKQMEKVTETDRNGSRWGEVIRREYFSEQETYRH